eukprot:TRINITY_DN3978_c0_g1_i15.p1 TRINITY_DN3978_c0_g1~~TRINITY_DN3978_c0_g1_i15.p1  ORF type:complete len:192 (+),score=52.72 TRINITY_DN3978_c0_g1_i15:66-641(+)
MCIRDSYNLLSPPGDFNPALGVLCNKATFQLIIQGAKLIAGPTSGKYWDLSNLPIMCSHEPGGTSIQDIVHWMQNYRKEGFYYFDYENETENLKHYNQTTPPSYPIENFKKWTVPTLLVVGNQDIITYTKDLETLIDLLKQNQEADIQVLEIDDYSHFDYLFGINANVTTCLLYTSPSPRDRQKSRMPSSA